MPTQPGNSGFTCLDNSPWTDPSDPSTSYGFVAVPAAAASCGQCYEFVYEGGGGFYEAGDPGARRLAGKRMVVQARFVNGAITARTWLEPNMWGCT